MTTTVQATIGTPLARVEGSAKVSGAARYAADQRFAEDLLHGCVVSSSIARGTIRTIQRDDVLAMPGVLAVIDHTNAPRLNDVADNEALQLQSSTVRHRGQAVALVVADTPQRAREAAAALVVEYDHEPHDVVLRADHPDLYKPEKVNPANTTDTEQGDVDAAIAAAPVTIDAEYTTPAEHNNPMEPHAATVRWVGDHLVAYDSNQGAARIKATLAGLFSLDPGSVQVLSEHVGGAFGAKGAIKVPVIAAAMASRMLARPVRVVLTRRQLFTMTGYRTPTVQRVRLAADRDGTLLALDHLSRTQTSKVLEFAEQVATFARTMYATPNLRTRHRVVALDLPTPRWMRAPGEAPGSFAVESALDELAAELRMDPVELRIRNEPSVEPETGLPYSSRSLVACLRVGAQRFGWYERDPRPGVRREGRTVIGTGVACGTYPARTVPSTAKATAEGDGTFTVRITATDIGTGARTALTQVAADELGVLLDGVRVLIGDSDFGNAVVAAGSMGMSSWSFAVVKACRALLKLLRDGQSRPVSATVDTAEDLQGMAPFAKHSFGAQFAEVRVDIDTGEVRVPRMLGIFGAGRVVNPNTARSQLVGGMIWGLGMALHEESILDVEYGDYVNHDLASYHVPVSADVGAIEADWVHEVDDQLNPLGVKGLGEIGIVGTAAAIANAVWHATGVRQRDLPIRPDRIQVSLPGLHPTC